MTYDVMKDVVVRAGIRDRLMSDMREALAAIADWPNYAAEHQYSDDVAGVQEFAAIELRRFESELKKL